MPSTKGNERSSNDCAKVLYIINAFNRGGAEKGLLHLVRMGAFAGCDISVVSLVRGESAYVEELNSLGVAVDFLADRRSMQVVDWLRSIPKLIARIGRVRPDVMILSLPQANIAGRIASKFFPKVLVASFEHNTHLSRRFYEILFRLTSGRVDWLIADSATTAEAAARRLYRVTPKRKTILPLVSFDIGRIEHLKRPANDARPAFVVVNAGRFTAVKNQIALVEALSLLRAKGHLVELVLYGEGGTLEGCRLAAERLGISDFVEFPGFHPDWADRAADLFVLPSLHEGLCIVALEAMSRGLPVVATNVGGLRDYGTDAKVFFLETPEPEVIASAIVRIMSDKALREEMRDAGLRTIKDRFSEAIVAERYASFNAELRR